MNENILYDLLNATVKETSEKTLRTLDFYETILDPTEDDNITDALVEAEMIYFRLGLEAGMKLKGIRG